MPKKSTHRSKRSKRKRNPVASFFRKPLVQLGIIVIAALAIFLIVTGGNRPAIQSAEVSADQAYQLYQQGALVLDVRSQQEWTQSHIPNAVLIPLEELPQRLDQLPHNRQIIVVCRTGVRSRTGRDILLQAGFENVTCLYGGITAWQAAGFPTVSGP
jgi:rhodanese-related sulfurtransferase